MSLAAAPTAPRLDALAWAALLGLALLWGASFPLIEVLLVELPVLTIVALRVFVAALFLWGVLIATGGMPPFTRRMWSVFAVIGLTNNLIPFLLIVAGQTEITASLAAILNATTPLFTALLAALVLSDEKLTLQKAAGLACGVVGVAIMLGPTAFAGTGSLWGPLAILGAAISYAVSAVFVRRVKITGVRPTAIAAGQTTMSSLYLVPMALLVDGPGAMAGVSAPIWLAVLVNGTLLTGFAYILYFTLLRRAGATNTTLVTVLIPVVAVLIGVGLLGEALSLAQAVGMVFIAAGLAVLDGRLLRR